MPSWEGYEDILRQLYPTADPKRIMKALNYRFTWGAITQKANELGIHRQGWTSFSGASPFDTMGYCRACDVWIPHEEISDTLRCTRVIDENGKVCNHRIRIPLKSKFWESRKKNAKQGTDVQ